MTDWGVIGLKRELDSEDTEMLNGTDERALKVIEEWRSKEYVAEAQATAKLQCLIDEALRQQDLLTRMKIADEVNKWHGTRAAETVLKTKAV